MLSGGRFQVSKPQVIYELFDDEVVIINLKSGSYYSLRKVGAEIWTMLEAGANAEEVADRLAARYDASRSEIETAIGSLLKEFQAEELIAPRNAEIGNMPSIPDVKVDGGKLAFQVPILEKYTDMEELLLLDPIHEVDEMGWPSVKQDPAK
jgi:hypothetical protein